MAKFTNPSKLSKDEIDKLIIQFCQAISLLKNPIEVAEFLKDLISSQEAEMLAKRLKIAELLLGGLTYTQIEDALRVNPNTVSRVNEWLRLSGDGYRLVLERMPKEEKHESFEGRFEPFSLRNIKKRYPMYYWPQIVIENILKTAKEKDKQKMRAVLRTMDKKTALFKQLNALLNPRKYLH
jgi:TrpR-related protein YerC/YecD